MDYNSKIKVAIIGAGRWGFNHVKTAAEILNPASIIICDSSNKSLKKVNEFKPDIITTNNIDDVTADNKINAVIVASPAETHYSIAKRMLKAGKNVLVEKPITLNTTDAEELLNISSTLKLKLMVGHILLYHPAVLKMKEGIEKGTLGRLQYIYSNRLNLGAIRSEENILWSFAPHDISLIQYFTGSNPVKIDAHGAVFLQEGVEDTTLTYLEYPGNIRAHIYVSWLHPFKEQRLVVVGEKGMYVFEDSAKTEKLKFYSKGFRKVNGSLEKFEEDYKVIEFENKSPLREEHLHFYNSIVNNMEPLTDGRHALEVLKILEEATRSLRRKSDSQAALSLLDN
jgi:UDP-2-acetamido-3-amino-2,3-dideoxy-glucuronate N-acetyltransferase